MIKAVIIDDEDLARERIRSFLTEHSDILVCAEFSNGSDALRDVQAIDPDLIFLDIQMPGMNGFVMLQALPENVRPAVIFITAYDEHAIEAFEVEALDYLLKPFTKERFARALERFRNRTAERHSGEYEQRLSRALEHVSPSFRYDRIPVKVDNGTVLVRVDDVDWAESESNYIRIHAAVANARLRDTMESFCKRLPDGRFLRIHRSIVVNVDRIVRIEPWARGEYIVVLRNGTKLKSGRAYGYALRELLG
ncbi:MAG TPA: LytTR family DNA-binding domain-containing protein [Candidatus Baltobacteraceae bacterium]|nr:LytTR family DNA-binding domain-containing protein [Candidatus Baltobacteraceae bacterium]